MFKGILAVCMVLIIYVIKKNITENVADDKLVIH